MGSPEQQRKESNAVLQRIHLQVMNTVFLPNQQQIWIFRRISSENVLFF